MYLGEVKAGTVDGFQSLGAVMWKQGAPDWVQDGRSHDQPTVLSLSDLTPCIAHPPCTTP